MRYLSLLSFFTLSVLSTFAQVPATWDQNTAYTHPALVLYGSTTYISLQDVPSGTTITSTAYWSTLDSQAPTTTPTGAENLTTPDTSEIANLTTPNPDGNTTETPPSGLTSASNEAFVRQQYIDFLGREADDEGLNFWLSEMAAGSKTRADVVNFFVFSDEFQNQVAPVSRLYQAYFLRIPDTSGLNYWIDKKLNGMTLNEISDSFAEVQEFSDRYGSLDDSGFVNLVYDNVLSRSPDDEGLAYWKSQMSDGMTRGEVMTGFSESAENQQNTLNQIRVIAFYYGMLRRAPDSEGFSYWVAKLDAGEQPNDLINGFIDSAEYQGRF